MRATWLSALVVLSACSSMATVTDAGSDAGLGASPDAAVAADLALTGKTCVGADSPLLGGPEDAGTTAVDTTCATAAPPPLDCQNFTLTGRLVHLFNNIPLGGAKIEAFDGSGALLRSMVVGDDGEYSLTVPGTTAGWKGHLVGSLDGYRIHDGYFTVGGLRRSGRQNLGLATDREIAGVVPTYGLPAPNPAQGFVDPIVLDCAGNFVAGIIIDIDRKYDARVYVDDNGNPSSTQKMTGHGESGALFVNVDPGPVVVTLHVANPDGTPGAIFGHGQGIAAAEHWTAILSQPGQ